MQVWSIYDQDHTALFSSNVRPDVEAEYRRLVEEDPPYAGVLHIAETELEFYGREGPADEGDEQALCVPPWLPLDEPIGFGPVRVDHWSAARQLVEEPARVSADILIGNFRNLHGAKLDCPVCWFADG